VIADVLSATKEKMTKAVGHTTAEFGSVRTGRASPALVEKLTVDYYGTEVPLQQLAGFTVPDARTLVVAPYDRGAVGAVEKALRNSDLGINPSTDGVVVRLAFPPLTAERRKDLVKVVKNMAEEGRVSVRNLRRTGRHELDALERDGDVSGDEIDRAAKDLDRLTATAIADIDTALEHKERELLEV